ncbi:MAG: hypothetical protein E7562_05100 [Ruminococcaceae bacterium]|nr:hypothetical protein [Oscillospiraceae bacterium]
MYIYETHIHTSACSGCARSTAIEHIDKAIEVGYSGIILTNHFYGGNTCIDRKLPWFDFVDAYRKDYIIAKEYAEKHNFDVIFGLEDGYGGGKEMLIYGIEPEAVMNEPDYPKMNLKEKSEFIHSCGGIVSSAHPFRHRSYILEPDTPPDASCFDAVEVFNFNNADEENDKALLFCIENNLLPISGGDSHIITELGGSGIVFNHRVKTEAELVTALRERDYKLVMRDKIVHINDL